MVNNNDIRLTADELARLRAVLHGAGSQERTEEPAPRPLVTQNEFLAACVLVVIFFMLFWR